MRRRNIVMVLGVIGMAFGFGSITVISQDIGSCPYQPVGSPFTCDHAYLINGVYVWMRPLYTGLGIASVVFLASTVTLALYLEYGSRLVRGRKGRLNRIQAGYVIGVGLLALGLFFGLFALGPCDAQNCLLWRSSVMVSLTTSYFLSLGLMSLGIGILAASFLMRRTNRGGTTTAAN